MPTKSHILGVVDDICTALYLDKQLGFKSHKTGHKQVEPNKSWKKNMLTFQDKMYSNAIKSTNFEFKICDYLESDLTNYDNIMIVSKKNLPLGTMLPELNGRTAIINDDEIFEDNFCTMYF